MTSRLLFASLASIVVASSGAAVVEGCGGDDAAPADDAAVPVDSGTDSSGGGGDGGGPELDAGDGNSIVLLATTTTGTTSQVAYGFTHRGSAWSAPAKVSDDLYGSGGGGVAAIAGGKVLGTFRPGASNTFQAALFDTTWSTAQKVGESSTVNDMGTGPAVAGTKAHVVFETTDGLRLATYDTTSRTWAPTAEVVLAGDPDLKPSIAVTEAGNLVVAYATGAANPRFDFTVRTGAAWSTPATLTTLAPDNAAAAPHPLLVKRAGRDEIYGFFYAKDPGTSTDAIDVTVYSGGTWSTPIALVTDMALVDATDRLASVVALADGRIAIAYKSATGTVSLDLFDGTNWAVSPTGITDIGSGVALTAGTGGATLELIYVDTAEHLRYSRFNGTTWTTAATIDAARTWSSVFAAPL